MKLIHTAALFWFVACASVQADIRTFSQSTTTRIENTGELSQGQRAGIEKFAQSKPYYGAIFIEEGGKGWGSYTGAHQVEDAIEISRRICELYADAGICVLAGLIYPDDYDKTAIAKDTLSRRASTKHDIYQSRTEGYRAFAVSGNTAFGWATRRDTASDAATAALTHCSTSSMKNLLKLQVDLREAAIEDGYFTCRIIDRSGPDTPPS